MIPAIAADRRLRHRRAVRTGALVLTSPQPTLQHDRLLASQTILAPRDDRVDLPSAILIRPVASMSARWPRLGENCRGDGFVAPRLFEGLPVLSTILLVHLLLGAHDCLFMPMPRAGALRHVVVNHPPQVVAHALATARPRFG